MSPVVFTVVLLAAVLHASWNALVKSGGDPYLRLAIVNLTHTMVATAESAFDFHDFAGRERFFAHCWQRCRRLWPDWDATLVELPPEVLVSETLSNRFDGLWLREPRQFLHEATPHARAYLDRFLSPGQWLQGRPAGA